MKPAMLEMLVLEHEFTNMALKVVIDAANQGRYMDVSVYEAELEENESDIEIASDPDDEESGGDAE